MLIDRGHTNKGFRQEENIGTEIDNKQILPCKDVSDNTSFDTGSEIYKQGTSVDKHCKKEKIRHQNCISNFNEDKTSINDSNEADVDCERENQIDKNVSYANKSANMNRESKDNYLCEVEWAKTPHNDYKRQDETLSTKCDVPMSRLPEGGDNSSTQPIINENIDGKWAWLILLSSFFIQFTIVGFDGISGILYLRFREKYKESAAVTAWLGSLPIALRLTLGPLSSAFCNRFTERKVVIFSGIILAVSMVVTGLAPNIVYAFLSFGILGGIGRSFAYCPAIVMLGLYFNKRQGMANGIAASGCGMGRFAFSFLVPILFVQFGYVGAFVAMGGLALIIVVLGIPMRPLIRRELSIDSPTKMKDSEKAKIKKALEVTSMFDNLKEDKDRVKGNNGESKTSANQKTKIFDFSLLKNIRFFGFCMAMLLSSLAQQSAFIFLPALAEELGVLGSYKSEYTLTITAIFNTLSRILIGFIFDCGIVRPHRVFLYNFLMFGLTLVSFVLPSSTSFIQLSFLCALYGFFSGSYTAQKTVVLVDILGRNDLKHSYGIVMMFQGIGAFLGPPLSGLVKDINGRYDMAFYIGGIGMLLGSVIMFLNNILSCLETRKTNKNNKIVDQSEYSKTIDICVISVDDNHMSQRNTV